MKIPYAKQNISEEDIQAVVKALHSDFITQGPLIKQFEDEIATYCGAKYAVAVSSATAGLHLACLVLGLKNNQSLWTSPNSFVASSNCALYCGATVDFVDIDPCSYNMSLSALEEKLKTAPCPPNVIVPVHFSGQSCDMQKIGDLARQYQFKVIEDASHAIGGDYQDKKVGCCEYSDMTIFSLHPAKIITTGEGGIVVTNNKLYYEKLLQLRHHGVTRDPSLMEGNSDGPWYYQQLSLGYNYRITDIQCALGLSQLNRIDTFIEKRRFLANRYDQLLKALPLQLPQQSENAKSAWHLYVVRLQLNQISKSHKAIFEELRSRGVLVNLHYIPIHLHPFYQKQGFDKGDFKESEKYYQEAISLPMYYDLSEKEQNYVVEVLEDVLNES